MTSIETECLEVENTPLVGPSTYPSTSRRNCHPLTALVAFLCLLALLLHGASVIQSRSRKKRGHPSTVPALPPSSPWVKLAPMRSPRCFHAAVAVSGRRIVVMGGAGNAPTDRHLATVEVYDAANDEWSDLPSMNEGRQSFGAAAVGDEIYVFGGLTEDAYATTSVEKLDLNRLELGWQMVVPMREARMGCAASAVGRHIYVSGGGNRHQASYGKQDLGNYTAHDHLASVERLDTQTGEWTSERSAPADMPCWRVGHGMFTMGSQLVVVGGLTKAEWNWVGVTEAETNSMVTYDTSKEGGWFWSRARWKKGPGMYQPRGEFGAASDGDLLIIAGGYRSGYQSIWVVEKYEKSGWSRLPDLGKHGFKSCFGPGLYAPVAAIVDKRFVLTGGWDINATSEVIALDYKKDWDCPAGRLPGDTCE